MSAKNLNLPVLIIITLFCLGIGFYAGTKYKTNNRSNFGNGLQMDSRNNRQGQNSSRPTGQTNRGFRPLVGEITSNDNKSITVKMTDGSSKIVLLGDSVQITQAQSAQIYDLKVGLKVSVFGQNNQDGSITAQNISLNPVEVKPTVIPSDKMPAK